MMFHVKQRGFTFYIVLAALLAFGGMATAIKVQSSRLASCKQEFAAFQADVKAKGGAAEKAARAKEAQDAKNTEKINNENKRLHAYNAALTRKLRNNHPAGSGLPETPTDTKRPDLYCAARQQFRAAYGVLVTELRAIADQCAADAVDLQSAREWAASVR